MPHHVGVESKRKLISLRETLRQLFQDALTNGFNLGDQKTLARAIEELKALFRYPSYSRMASEIGVSSRVLLDRVRRHEYPPSLFNYHRVIQGLIRISNEALNDDNETLPDAVRVASVAWMEMPHGLHDRVALVIELLSQVVVQLDRSNEPPSVGDLLNPIDKAQLIATLETALAILKTPLVEPGLLRARLRIGILKDRGM